jgi:ABC-type multidrug transport system ATPase subunit
MSRLPHGNDESGCPAGIARGLVSAVMQTGGLLKDLTAGETAQYTASLFAQAKPVAEVLDRAGITGHRRSPGRQVLRR